MPKLIPALKNDRGCACSSAASTLGWMGEEARSAGPALIQALQQDQSLYVRSRVALALGKIGSVDAVPALTQSLKDPNQEVRASAAKLLGKMRKMEIAPALTQVLQDELWFVRDAAPALI